MYFSQSICDWTGTGTDRVGQANPRSTAILAVAKANNLDIEVVPTDTDKPSGEYLKYNPLSKVPTFVGSDGYVLSECIAIAIYGESESDQHSKTLLPLPVAMMT